MAITRDIDRREAEELARAIALSVVQSSGTSVDVDDSLQLNLSLRGTLPPPSYASFDGIFEKTNQSLAASASSEVHAHKSAASMSSIDGAGASLLDCRSYQQGEEQRCFSISAAQEINRTWREKDLQAAAPIEGPDIIPESDGEDEVLSLRHCEQSSETIQSGLSLPCLRPQPVPAAEGHGATSTIEQYSAPPSKACNLSDPGLQRSRTLSQEIESFGGSSSFVRSDERLVLGGAGDLAGPNSPSLTSPKARSSGSSVHAAGSETTPASKQVKLPIRKPKRPSAAAIKAAQDELRAEAGLGSHQWDQNVVSVAPPSAGDIQQPQLQESGSIPAENSRKRKKQDDTRPSPPLDGELGEKSDDHPLGAKKARSRDASPSDKTEQACQRQNKQSDDKRATAQMYSGAVHLPYGSSGAIDTPESKTAGNSSGGGKIGESSSTIVAMAFPAIDGVQRKDQDAGLCDDLPLAPPQSKCSKSTRRKAPPAGLKARVTIPPRARDAPTTSRISNSTSRIPNLGPNRSASSSAETDEEVIISAPRLISAEVGRDSRVARDDAEDDDDDPIRLNKRTAARAAAQSPSTSDRCRFPPGPRAMSEDIATDASKERRPSKHRGKRKVEKASRAAKPASRAKGKKRKVSLLDSEEECFEDGESHLKDTSPHESGKDKARASGGSARRQANSLAEGGTRTPENVASGGSGRPLSSDVEEPSTVTHPSPAHAVREKENASPSTSKQQSDPAVAIEPTGPPVAARTPTAANKPLKVMARGDAAATPSPKRGLAGVLARLGHGTVRRVGLYREKQRLHTTINPSPRVQKRVVKKLPKKRGEYDWGEDDVKPPKNSSDEASSEEEDMVRSEDDKKDLEEVEIEAEESYD